MPSGVRRIGQKSLGALTMRYLYIAILFISRPIATDVFVQSGFWIGLSPQASILHAEPAYNPGNGVLETARLRFPPHPGLPIATIRDTLRPYIQIALLALIIYSLYQIWRLRFQSRIWWLLKKGKYGKAIEIAQQAIEHYPKDYKVFFYWGWLLAKIALDKHDRDSEGLLQEACEKFDTASQLKPGYSAIYFRWATTLCRLAIKDKNSGEQLFQAAFEKFAQAARLKPKDHRVLMMWGLTLSCLAVRKKDPQAIILLEQAIEKMKSAHQVRPKDSHVLFDWGYTIAVLASHKEQPDKESLYQTAIEKFKESINIKPVYAEAYVCWGNCLRSLALLKEGTDRQELYKRALDHFEQAVRLKPDNPRVYSDYADFLLTYATDSSPSDCANLFQKAFNHYLKATELFTDSEDLIHVFDEWGIAFLEYSKRAF
jgi:tetratricopeptide (TPR) repeat protein